MASNTRESQKFKVGDTVRVTSTRLMRFHGFTGRIVGVKESRHFARYVVDFEVKSEPHQAFWNRELLKVPPRDSLWITTLKIPA
jgi:hypothetical protein